MEKDNKEFDIDTQELDPEEENKSTETPETWSDFSEEDFDPTESEEFYNNLEAAISSDTDAEDTELPELILTEETFDLDEGKEQPANSALEEELFAGVDAALAEQIEQEFGGTAEDAEEEKKPSKIASIWKAIPTWTKVLVSVILVILISVGLLFGTERGRKIVYDTVVDILFERMNVDDPQDGEITEIPELTVTLTPEPTEELTATPEPTENPDQNPDTTPEPTEDPAVTPEPTATPTPVIEIMDDENIINVLLLGEENMNGGIRGRTDAIILVSINLNGGPLKMVSFMRDLYVDIPGYGNDKLNSAYAKRGAELTVKTIEQNFGVDIDAYAVVGFDGFEDIIDKLGGLRLSLTARESEYLNTTKYISKPSERNTVAGEQMMTGAQVLGYCRVRYITTENGLSNDRGRNYRQRVVLQAIFDQYRTLNITQINSIMEECLGYVTVSSNLQELAKECVFAVMEKKMFEIESMQVPQDGMYTYATIAKQDVVCYYPECVPELQKFLYGE